MWGEISDRSKFAYDANRHFIPEATTFLMSGKSLPYLLCVLNSPLSEWFFSKLGTTTGVGTVRWKKYTIEELLIPKAEEYVVDQIECLVMCKKLVASVDRFDKVVPLTEFLCEDNLSGKPLLVRFVNRSLDVISF